MIIRLFRRPFKRGSSSSICDAEMSASTSSMKTRSDSRTDSIYTLAEDTMEKTPVKKVSFSTIGIRSYNLIVGDNPFVEFPLSLGWKFTELPNESIHKFDERNHISNPDYIRAKDMEPFETEERRQRLRSFGYTNAELLKEDRRRKVQLVMEWAYRNNKEDENSTPAPVRNAHVFLERYVV